MAIAKALDWHHIEAKLTGSTAGKVFAVHQLAKEFKKRKKLQRSAHKKQAHLIGPKSQPFPW